MLHKVLNNQALREMINLEELHYYPKYWSLYSNLKFNNHIKHQAKSIVICSVSPRQMFKSAENIVGLCGMVLGGTCVIEAGIQHSQLWEDTILSAFLNVPLFHSYKRPPNTTQYCGTNSWTINMLQSELFHWHLPYDSLGFMRKINRQITLGKYHNYGMERFVNWDFLWFTSLLNIMVFIVHFILSSLRQPSTPLFSGIEDGVNKGSRCFQLRFLPFLYKFDSYILPSSPLIAAHSFHIFWVEFRLFLLDLSKYLVFSWIPAWFVTSVIKCWV